MLGHSSIVLTADTYTSVLPDVARGAAEDIASLIVAAGCPVPGTRRRRPAWRSVPRQARALLAGGLGFGHPGRQISGPRRRPATGTGRAGGAGPEQQRARLPRYAEVPHGTVPPC